MGNRPRSLELFTGGGGLALGLDAAGFEHVALVEWDDDACATLRSNAGTVGSWTADEVHHGDVRAFDYGSLSGTVDVIAAGVPCQPFSLGGVHRGRHDERNMFPALLEGIRNTHPKVVLVENVPGLARPAFRAYFDYILAQLAFPFISRRRDETWVSHMERLGGHGPRDAARRYHVDWRRVNAADYGVPQRRGRVVIQAVRSDVADGCAWPKESHGEVELARAKADGTYWSEHRLTPLGVNPVNVLALPMGGGAKQRWRTVRDALTGLPDPRGSRTSRVANHVFVPGARTYPGHTGSLLDEPAKTLKAGVHGVPGGEGTIVLEDGSVRYLSVREAARIQTFPDEYRFCGSRSECMRQVGNAVPVRMAEALGRTMRTYLEGSERTVQVAAR